MQTKVSKGTGKNQFLFTLSMKGLTQGELLSIRNALQRWAMQSPVAQDVLNSLNAELVEKAISL